MNPRRRRLARLRRKKRAKVEALKAAIRAELNVRLRPFIGRFQTPEQRTRMRDEMIGLTDLVPDLVPMPSFKIVVRVVTAKSYDDPKLDPFSDR